MELNNDAERSLDWVVTAVEASDFAPAFAYSVGFGPMFVHPEVIVFGLRPDQAHALLQVVAEDLSRGKSYAATGEYGGLLREGRVAFRPVHETQHEIYLGDAMERHRVSRQKEPLQAVQLFWPDRRGLFPYQPGCDATIAALQPRLELPLTPNERAQLLGPFED